MNLVPSFDLDYDDQTGVSNDTAVLLHGWPGDRTDWRAVRRSLKGRIRVIAPDLRGFGRTGWRDEAIDCDYAAEGQATSVIDLILALGTGPVVLAGYDIGSRIAVKVAELRPDLTSGLVITPPLYGAGARVLEAMAQKEFWYQSFHQMDLAAALIDGRRDAVSTYLAHFWHGWSGPQFTPEPDALAQLVDAYARPGAFRASIAWYRAGAGTVAASLRERPPNLEDRVAVPTTVLWPAEDPLFPVEWADRAGDWFSAIRVRHIANSGHFVPLEAPELFAAALLEHFDMTTFE